MKRINWTRVFAGPLREFTEDEQRAAGGWPSCALGENDPKLAKRFQAVKKPKSNKQKALFELGALFPLVVCAQEFAQAKRVYNAMRAILGKPLVGKVWR